MSGVNALPCPFCGGTEFENVREDTFRWRLARCNGCGAQTAGSGSRDDWERRAHVDALAEWNLRSMPTEDQFSDDPDDSQIADACLWLRHDFGLMEDSDRARLMDSMRAHWQAVWKAVHSPERHRTLKPVLPSQQ